MYTYYTVLLGNFMEIVAFLAHTVLNNNEKVTTSPVAEYNNIIPG